MSIAALAAHAVGIRAGAQVRQGAVALHAFDTLAVIAGGLATREGAAIARFFASGDGAARAAGLAAVARFTECDDIHVPSCMTAGSIAIPVALQFADSDAAFASAVKAAYATGIALAEAVGGVEALEHGVWPAIFAAPAVAAVACAVALQSDEKTVANAIALALAAASGRVGRPGGSPSGRWFLYGEATLKGIRAALAARQGFGGDLSLLSEKWLAQQTAPALARMEPLNLRPHDAVSKVGLKPFVAARQGSNAIQAFVALLEGGLRADEIERVDVALPAVALPVVSRPLDPSIRLSTIANMGLQLGVAAFERDRLLDIGREADFDTRSVAFARKVNVVAGAAPTDGAYGWPATVRVHTAHGVQELHCACLHGDPDDSGLARLVRSKLARCDAAIRELAGADGPELSWPEAYERLQRIYAQLNPHNKIEQTAVTGG
jgi:2-methylcitrate dehydratase PrpD